ncbi:MAG: GNAT family N-acetyltransferase [Candidatus Poribacteria bacterium]|nr:GNAT family N-acetyltransferase [Candidatus Poribacteria bacterium]
MEGLSIRQAQAADSEFVFTTKKEAFREYVDRVWGWDESHQRELHNARFASHDFSIIGFRGTNVGYFATSNTSERLTLHQLFIRPEYQGRGIGSACMTRIVNEAKMEQKPVMLQVLKIYTRAIAFYQRLGFKIAGKNFTHVRMVRNPD